MSEPRPTTDDHIEDCSRAMTTALTEFIHNCGRMQMLKRGHEKGPWATLSMKAQGLNQHLDGVLERQQELQRIRHGNS